MLAKIIKYTQNTGNAIAVVILVSIFVMFCMNVISRYIFGTSYGWIVEVSLTFWLWIVFIGASFCLSDRDHVSFNLIGKLPKKLAVIFRQISYVIVVGGAIYMIPPVWSYIDFLAIRPSDNLGIPMKYIFIVYMVFLFALVIKYTYRIITTLLGKPIDHD